MRGSLIPKDPLKFNLENSKNAEILNLSHFRKQTESVDYGINKREKAQHIVNSTMVAFTLQIQQSRVQFSAPVFQKYMLDVDERFNISILIRKVEIREVLNNSSYAEC